MLDPKSLRDGHEQHEKFTVSVGAKRKTKFQYDYRHTDGKLFSVVKSTLKECREARDNAIMAPPSYEAAIANYEAAWAKYKAADHDAARDDAWAALDAAGAAVDAALDVEKAAAMAAEKANLAAAEAASKAIAIVTGRAT
jgi:FMN phosphatase YigB (HAD superfamily)